MFAKGAPRSKICRFRPLNRFLSDERGTVTIFAALITMVMMTLGGLALDVIRFEAARSQLQSTMDRAIFAAANSATSSAEVWTVVNQYLETQDLDNFTLTPDYRNENGLLVVGGRVEQALGTYFLRYFGFPSLTVRAQARVEQNIRSIEISLVIDRSGSMRDSGKLDRVKAATTAFVSDMLSEDTEGNVLSFSVVPYNDRIIAGTDLASVFNFGTEHSQSTCARFPPDSLAQIAVTPDDPIDRVMHFDYANHLIWRNFDSPYCPSDDSNAILPWENEAAIINAHIQGLTAEGYSRPTQAVKWAAVLLDPAAQPAASDLASGGVIPTNLGNRPLAYSPSALKVIILVADGTTSGDGLDIHPNYKTGPSPIYHFNQSGTERWSVYHPATGLYYVSSSARARDLDGYWQAEPYMGAQSVRLTWSEVWARWTYQTILNSFLFPSSQRAVTDGRATQDAAFSLYNHFRDNALDWSADPAMANADLVGLCSAAIEQGIVIFTISLNGTAGDTLTLRNCAGNPANHYFSLGTDLNDIFGSVSEAIGTMRLIE
ncbi:pilus assembly protein TadG-related protein [Rhodobacteraceae bacterium XHP0102]|nr:pilus assembly protein TadG-related protein [Rhodobacteraceae bacterium XHP0102]